jgi:hypothetical protein
LVSAAFKVGKKVEEATVVTVVSFSVPWLSWIHLQSVRGMGVGEVCWYEKEIRTQVGFYAEGFESICAERE